MKKLLIGTVATVLMAGGLVGVGATADAAPYPGTVKTKCQATKGETSRRSANISVRVTSDAGDPKGDLDIVFVNKDSGKSKKYSRDAQGGPNFTFAPLKAGDYSVSVSYDPKNDSKWKPCSDSIGNLKVLPRKR